MKSGAERVRLDHFIRKGLPIRLRSGVSHRQLSAYASVNHTERGELMPSILSSTTTESVGHRGTCFIPFQESNNMPSLTPALDGQRSNSIEPSLGSH